VRSEPLSEAFGSTADERSAAGSARFASLAPRQM